MLRYRQARIQCATAHRRWTGNQWNEVVFTDESPFNVDFGDGRARVWWRRDGRFPTEKVIEHDRYRRGSVMIWGGISHREKTGIIIIVGNLTADRHCNEILHPVLVPFLRNGLARMLQQINARSYIAG